LIRLFSSGRGYGQFRWVNVLSPKFITKREIVILSLKFMAKREAVIPSETGPERFSVPGWSSGVVSRKLALSGAEGNLLLFCVSFYKEPDTHGTYRISYSSIKHILRLINNSVIQKP